MLQSVGLKRVGHDLVTEQQHSPVAVCTCVCVCVNLAFFLLCIERNLEKVI